MIPTDVTLFKDARSPFWFVYWTTASGRRVKRSTKVPHAGGIFSGERLTKSQAEKRAYAVGYQLARTAESAPAGQSNMTVRELFDKMLDGKLGRVSLATYDNARTDYASFCKWLGKRAHEPARLITRADMKSWINFRRAEVRCKTVKKAVSALSAAFGWGVDAGLFPVNPCLGCKIPPDTKEEKIIKEAFTAAEIQLLIDKLPTEWSSAVRCCLGTYGQRLGDILSLKWEQFDFTARVVRIVSGKTGRELIQPMQEDFYTWAVAAHAAAQKAGGDSAIYVHPTLRKHSNASSEFTQLVRLHGIGLAGENAGGKRRTWHSKTFHGLRRSVVTMLHEAGVSEGLCMQLIGHDSAEVHHVYLAPSTEQLADTAAKIQHFGAFFR